MRSQFATVTIAALLVVAGIGVAFGTPADTGTDDTEQATNATTEAAVAQFGTEAAFDDYVRAGLLRSQQSRPRPVVIRDTPDVALNRAVTASAESAPTNTGAGGDGGSASAPSRVGTTNVQIAGLDEPDIVKTDGRNFYYAPEGQRRIGAVARPSPRVDVRVAPREPLDSTTHVVDASDPADPEAIDEIDATGKLLQTGETLVVIGQRELTGYDVSDPENPTKAWETPLNHSVVTARERNGTVYLVTRSGVRTDTPCPIEPLGETLTIPCGDVYRPSEQIPVDSTYTALSLNASAGTVADSVSFVGTRQNTVVHVSGDAMYVTYTQPTSRAQQLGRFLRTEFEQTPDHVRDRIAEIQSYNISEQSKYREIDRVFQRWLNTLPADERDGVRSEFHREFDDYRAQHQRDSTTTGIVRVDVDGDTLAVEATGTVPGRPLDQFSMDQHNGTLRITTTVPAVGSADSTNDLYVLDSETLSQRGAATDMGVTERVYSVRYVDDTAYVVTFRRIDPFHVVDLSDPEDPEVVGELKLPGFSSYLHPIDEDHVLGIGEEDGRVKTVLFDVSDPSDPTIDDDRILRGEHWSAISQSHHAFTIDRKHGVFFLPTGDEGVVMNYTDGRLSETARIAGEGPVSRARYVDDYLYVFSEGEIVVVDETDWRRETTLDLDG